MPVEVTGGVRYSIKVFCFVSGHDFSRAVPGQNGQGFSPCHRTIRREFNGNAQGLKPHSFRAFYGTTEVVP
jgi:hypothetical protein